MLPFFPLLKVVFVRPLTREILSCTIAWVSFITSAVAVPADREFCSLIAVSP